MTSNLGGGKFFYGHIPGWQPFTWEYFSIQWGNFDGPTIKMSVFWAAELISGIGQKTTQDQDCIFKVNIKII